MQYELNYIFNPKFIKQHKTILISYLIFFFETITFIYGGAKLIKTHDFIYIEVDFVQWGEIFYRRAKLLYEGCNSCAKLTSTLTLLATIIAKTCKISYLLIISKWSDFHVFSLSKLIKNLAKLSLFILLIKVSYLEPCKCLIKCIHHQCSLI